MQSETVQGSKRTNARAPFGELLFGIRTKVVRVEQKDATEYRAVWAMLFEAQLGKRS